MPVFLIGEEEVVAYFKGISRPLAGWAEKKKKKKKLIQNNLVKVMAGMKTGHHPNKIQNR